MQYSHVYVHVESLSLYKSITLPQTLVLIGVCMHKLRIPDLLLLKYLENNSKTIKLKQYNFYFSTTSLLICLKSF